MQNVEWVPRDMAQDGGETACHVPEWFDLEMRASVSQSIRSARREFGLGKRVPSLPHRRHTGLISLRRPV